MLLKDIGAEWDEQENTLHSLNRARQYHFSISELIGQSCDFSLTTPHQGQWNNATFREVREFVVHVVMVIYSL